MKTPSGASEHIAVPTDQSKKPATVTLILEEEVTHGGKTYAELTFGKRKVRDLIAADVVKGQTRKVAAVYASMAGVPIQAILELTSEDYDQLEVQVAPLMGKSWEEAKMGFLTEDAMNASLTAGVQAEMARRDQASD